MIELQYYLSNVPDCLIYGLLAMGIYISLRILDIPDLTTEGSFGFGVNFSYKYNKVSFGYTTYEIKNRLHKINVTYFLYRSIFLTLFIKHFFNCCNLSANN